MGNCVDTSVNSRYGAYGNYPTSTSDPLLLDEEAVDNTSLHTLLNDDPAAPSGYDFKQIQSLMSLTLSDNVEMQKNAAVGFLRMSKNSHQPVMSVVLEAMTNLLLSSDDEVLRISSLAMGNFAIYGPAVNKSSIIHSGCLRPLIFLLKSQNLDIQCNSCACLTTLASSDANRLDIVHQGAVRSLINLARQSDTKAQVGASGALLNLSHSGKCRMQLVEYGVIPVLIDLLKSPEESVQFYTAAALSNIVVEVHHRRLVMEHQGGIVIERLVYLMRSTNQRVQSQSCLAFRNIASEDRYQVQLVKSGGLAPLLILIKSDSLEVSVAAVAALRNLSIHSSNAGTIVDAGFLPELGTLLDSHHCPDLQYHVAGTLRNLAAEDRVNNILESGCLSHLAGVLRDSSVVTERVLSECTVTLSALASSGDVQTILLTIFDGNFYKIILQLMKSPILEIQLNCATILGCLMGRKELHKRLKVSGRFLSEVLDLYICSKSQDLQQMAMWLVLQLHYSGFSEYRSLLPPQFIPAVEALKMESDHSSKYEATLVSLTSIMN